MQLVVFLTNRLIAEKTMRIMTLPSANNILPIAKQILSLRSYTYLYMRTQNEDFRLRVFLTLAEEGSFTRTAAVLGITQPGVSQHISELERIYGIRLFNRERGAVSLTKEGREFREYALRIEGAYMDAAVFAEENGRNSESQEHIAVEMVRSLLPILRKMNSGFAEDIERLLTSYQEAQ